MQFLIENFESIGTRWWIELLNADQSLIPGLLPLKERVIDLMKEFESSYSRFISSSYIGKLNKHKHLFNPPIELIDMINWGEELRLATENSFNLAVGGVLEDMGYDKEYSFKSKQSSKNTLSSHSNFHLISESKIEMDKNIRVDLGGIGKGWLIDLIRKLLDQSGIDQYLINGGGDIYIKSNSNINLKLESPFEEKKYIGEVSIKNKALGSSSPKLRRWKDKSTGEIRHHLLNMNDQKSVQQISAVFTISDNAKLADAISTCIFTSSGEVAKRISKKYNTEYAIIFSDGKYAKSKGFEGEFYS